MIEWALYLITVAVWWIAIVAWIWLGDWMRNRKDK